MNSSDQSTRSRYGRESTQSVFDSVFNRQPNTHSGLILAVIFIGTVFGIVVLHDSDSVFWVFALGAMFAWPFLREHRARRGPAAGSPGQPPPIPTAPGQSISPEAERLLTVLEQLEKRLINLETIVTQREFDWERRLNQDPPPSAPPRPAAAVPSAASSAV